MVARNFEFFDLRIFIFCLFFVPLFLLSIEACAQESWHDIATNCEGTEGLLSSPIIVLAEAQEEPFNSFKIIQVLQGNALKDEIVRIRNVRHSDIDFKNKERYMFFLQGKKDFDKRYDLFYYQAESCKPVISLSESPFYVNSLLSILVCKQYLNRLTSYLLFCAIGAGLLFLAKVKYSKFKAEK